MVSRPTFEEALKHKWLCPVNSLASKAHLESSHSALKKFNARKKFKGAINKVRGALRISKIASFAGRVKEGALAAQTE